MKAIIFIGIQASGKTTFFEQNLEAGFVRISMDELHNRNKERRLVQECVEAGKDFVIDNTNPTREDRQRYLSLVSGTGYEVDAYFFQSRVQDCVRRNQERGETVPAKAIAATSNRLEQPSYEEGFDHIKYVAIKENGYEISDWEDQK